MSITNMINGARASRYLAAIALQGPGFLRMRTPWRLLGKDARGLLALPSAESFGDDRHPLTDDVLAGKTMPHTLGTFELARADAEHQRRLEAECS